MKVCQAIHFPLSGAGAGVYADNLAKVLPQQGCTLYTLCADHIMPSKPYPVEAVLFSNGSNSVFDLPFDFPVLFSHPLSNGSTFGRLTRIQLASYTQAFRQKLDRIVLEHSPDVLHIHHGWVLSTLLSSFPQPYVISLHATELRAFQAYPQYQRLVLPGLRKASLLTALTEDERQKASRTYGIEIEKIKIIDIGIDTSIFRSFPVSRASLLETYSIHDSDRAVVLFAGRLTAQKGVDTLIRAAWEYSRSSNPPMMTLIVGEGDQREHLERLGAQLGVENVYFLGYQNREALAALYNIADVVVLPSIFEGLNLTALEALSCGTPVIASDISGFRETIYDSIGSLIAPSDSSSLAMEVARFLRSGFKASASTEASEYIRVKFGQHASAQSIARVYDAVSR